MQRTGVASLDQGCALNFTNKHCGRLEIYLYNRPDETSQMMLRSSYHRTSCQQKCCCILLCPSGIQKSNEVSKIAEWNHGFPFGFPLAVGGGSYNPQVSLGTHTTRLAPDQPKTHTVQLPFLLH